MKNALIPIVLLGFAVGCGSNIMESINTDSATDSVVASESKSARIVFHQDNFRNIRNDWPSQGSMYACLGDVLKVFKTTGDDFQGSPTEFETLSSDAFAPTEKPPFLKNVSVDMTKTYFNHIVEGTFVSDLCSYRSTLEQYTDHCAEFDDPAVVYSGDALFPTGPLSANPTPTPIMGYSGDGGDYDETLAYDALSGTGFYRVRDYYCIGQGPNSSMNIEVSKANVGGVDVDIDRSALGEHENLLFVLTYQAMGAEYEDTDSRPLQPSPATGTISGFEPSDDETVLRVKLQSTGLDYEALISALQPRSRYYSSGISTLVENFITIRDPFHGIRTEFIEIPLSMNSLIDRVRIERVRGSFVLYQLDIFRMGARN